ncbi:hypothetical protein L6164_016870 [Bauhinia variegata]|uniref:Uncharacterized protein n=1 Tax=Bauhinia variegata TaxID=167791 RepID=A0ACB9N822_BAUVA|nr:hypothetical protein L6164_016870 [Bauhinia variegata]
MELPMARSAEVCLRISAILVLIVTTCVVAFDTQTELILSVIEKKASYRDVNALKILMYVTSAAAGYNFLQLCKYPASVFFGRNLIKGSYINFSWVCFLLDQHSLFFLSSLNFTWLLEICINSGLVIAKCRLIPDGQDDLVAVKDCDVETVPSTLVSAPSMPFVIFCISDMRLLKL